jgi:hypothetical protein
LKQLDHLKGTSKKHVRTDAAISMGEKHRVLSIPKTIFTTDSPDIYRALTAANQVSMSVSKNIPIPYRVAITINYIASILLQSG